MKKGLLLLSGGIDSPIAAKLMLDRGVEIIAVHFSNEPFTNDEPEVKSKKAAKILGIKKIIVKNISKQLSTLTKDCYHKFYFVLSKRLMFRLAEKIAHEEGCDFLISGENLGQVSSQTLQNLSVIDQAVKIPILRPLLTYDKNEIIKIAHKIDTFEVSKGPEMCCVLGPSRPATGASLEQIEREEAKLSF